MFDGGLRRTLITAAGIGLVDFSLIVHLDNPNHGDVSLANAAIWAARLQVPTYAIDEQTAIKVIDDTVDASPRTLEAVRTPVRSAVLRTARRPRGRA